MPTPMRAPGGEASSDRQQFLDRLALKLRAFERDIQRLQEHARAIRSAGKAPPDESVIGLEQQRSQIQRMLADMESSGRAGWVDARPKLERALTNLSTALDAAKKQLV